MAVPFALAGMVEDIGVDTFWEDHSHATDELVWNLRGASQVWVGGRAWTITPRIGLWLPAGTLHRAYTPAGTSYRATHFGARASRTLAPEPAAVEITDLLKLLLERLDGELAPESRELAEAMVQDVLEVSDRHLDVPIPAATMLAPVVDTVLRDPADGRGLEEWAVAIGVSSRTVSRAFRSQTGMSFVEWVVQVRAQRAVLLLCGGAEIAEVARIVGYRSTSAFGAAFRRATGMTPGQFQLSTSESLQKGSDSSVCGTPGSPSTFR